MIGGLRDQGFRVVTIVDAHPPQEPGYRDGDEGTCGVHFVTRPDGSEFSGTNLAITSGQQQARQRVSRLHSGQHARLVGWALRRLLDLGVAGIWNDMNEPSVWIKPAWTMPLDLRHDNDGQPTDHAEVHNVYGMLNTRSTLKGCNVCAPKRAPSCADPRQCRWRPALCGSLARRQHI